MCIARHTAHAPPAHLRPCALKLPAMMGVSFAAVAPESFGTPAAIAGPAGGYDACSHHSPSSACCRNAMKLVTLVDTSLGEG